MATLSVGILGLGRVGASVGLALKRYMGSGGKYEFDIVGYDRRIDVGIEAKTMGAIQQLEKREYNAVQDKDIVVLDLPYDELKQTYELIAADLRDGVVILDFAPLKKPSVQWVNKYLSEENHLVGVTAVINPDYLFDNKNETEGAREDLFDKGAMILAPSAACIKEAVDLAYNFTSILGAKSHFLDPAEHDSLIAFTEGLPSLLGMSLFYSVSKNPGWGDIQRFTNPGIASLVRPLHDYHPDALRDFWMLNDDNLVNVLDRYIDTLTEVRDIVAERDQDAIEAVVGEASSEYEKWINRRVNAEWDEKMKLPDASSGIMSSLLGSRLANRLSGGKDDSD